MGPLEIVMLGVLGLLIFFMVRNSRKRRADMEQLQNKMVPGAEVMTNFGLFGTLVALDEDANIATIEVSPGSTIRVHRQTLARVVEDTVADSADELDEHAPVIDEAAPRLNESSVDPGRETKKTDD
ncbi:protein translocase subunit yajC [Microcella putealis]|uniref:Protein translocase subunit yajC n=1 Tax=Microcella putealis TaxID=337005 RepID=A0A4Q7LI87_9MICO|nr:preprotein translocase subunit YajC [Microcella putealis]RZS54256.1 protein translocase subunit yajC [Microcella putealis]TQM24990.1 protein translocase subunit yajC [Microcella putealis]